MRSVLREPLVHFVIAGAVIFAVFSSLPPDAGERRIVLDEGVLTRLVERYVETYHRAPSPKELQGLIADTVKDQVYYREAQRLGLDRDDEIVIRRMRGKMQALATSEAETKQASDAELQALLDRDPAHYATDVVTTFDQVWLGPDSPDTRGGAAGAVERLNAGAAPTSVGQMVALPLHFERASTSDVSAQLGDAFAAALRDLPQGRWTGPIGSGLGLHVVKVRARTVPTKPTLATVRQRVENDWRAGLIARAEDKAYAKMLAGYQVEIARPK
jgi:peptidyl-prolyl cis-trans isomerase C